jgi:Multicopper oxidase
MVRAYGVSSPSLHLVSMSCDPAYRFSIDGHRHAIMEANGISVQPLLLVRRTELEFSPVSQTGQRHSAVVTRYS